MSSESHSASDRSSVNVRQRSRSRDADAAVQNTDPQLSRAVARFEAKLVERPLAELKPSKRNARTHSDKQIHQIAESIKAFGFVTPVLIDGDDVIVAGHGRYEAARRLGLSSVPTIRLDHLSRDQIRAFALADNRPAELAGWDNEILKIELGALIEMDCAIELTGFATPLGLVGRHGLGCARPAILPAGCGPRSLGEPRAQAQDDPDCRGA